MRSAHVIEPSGEEERFVHAFDIRDIDATNPYSFWRLKYLQRIHATIRRVSTYCPPGSRIAEIGSAQANMSLILAEVGYDCVAYDLREEFLSYSRKKFERGKLGWVCGNAFECAELGSFDGVLLCELLEHVAHPDRLIEKCLELLLPGGVLIMTTPNSRFIRSSDLPYHEAVRNLQKMEDEQFGPAGEHHLFNLSMEELRSIVPKGTEILDQAWLDSIVLNGHAQWLLNQRTPRSLLLSVNAHLCISPMLRESVCSCLLMVVRKPGYG
jgi:2-polyprenyl-6-hydroxyphenyl methylase/3-demethylubiquinone-9 3-methyltransferase